MYIDLVNLQASERTVTIKKKVCLKPSIKSFETLNILGLQFSPKNERRKCFHSSIEK